MLKLASMLMLFMAAGRAEPVALLKKRLLAKYAGKRGLRPSIDAVGDDDECIAEPPPPDVVTTQISVDRFHALDMRNQKWGFVGCVIYIAPHIYAHCTPPLFSIVHAAEEQSLLWLCQLLTLGVACVMRHYLRGAVT